MQYTRNPFLFQAKRFTKKSLRCKAYIVDEQQESKNRLMSQIDEALDSHIEMAIKFKEDKEIAAYAKRKDSSLLVMYETFKKKSGYEKMRIFLRYIIIFHCVRYISVKPI